MKGGLTFAFVVAIAVACEPQRVAGEARDLVEGGSVRQLCETRCARSIRCSGPRAAVCACGSPAASDTSLLRADWTRAVMACLGRTGCDVEEDCENEGYRAIGASPFSWPPVVMRCLERGDACGGSSATCRRIAAMNEEARAEADRCFDEPCRAYAACFESFLETRVTPLLPGWR